MSFSKPSLSRLIGLCIAMIPLAANADTGQIAGQTACTTLLTEAECHNYQNEQRQLQSDAERAMFEGKYAALLQERLRLCPHPISLDEPEAVRSGQHTKRARFIVGRKISM